MFRLFEHMLRVFFFGRYSIASLELNNNTGTKPSIRRRYRLSDLLANFDETKKHAEIDWGKPEGKGVW